MAQRFERIKYGDLNSRQQENYNYQQVSGVLAEFGYLTIRLSDDWKGADFLAQHMLDGSSLKVQLKGRLTFERKYQGKDIWVCFRHEQHWYLYPHDELLEAVLASSTVGKTESWKKGTYSFPHLSSKLRKLLAPYGLGSAP
jgi:hypothetical protein